MKYITVRELDTEMLIAYYDAIGKELRRRNDMEEQREMELAPRHALDGSVIRLKNASGELGPGYKVLVGESMEHVRDAVTHAAVTGSIGETLCIDETFCGGEKRIVAKVRRVDHLPEAA